MANHNSKPVAGTLVPNQTKRIMLVDETLKYVSFTFTLDNTSNITADVEFAITGEESNSGKMPSFMNIVLDSKKSYTSPVVSICTNSEAFLFADIKGVSYSINIIEMVEA